MKPWYFCYYVFLLYFPHFFVPSAPFMSYLLSFLSEHKFTPSNFDSVLNPYSNYNTNDNVDQHLGCNCKYFDSNAITYEGALHQNEFSIFHHCSRSLNKKANITVDYGEWSKPCRFCEGRAAANLAKLV